MIEASRVSVGTSAVVVVTGGGGRRDLGGGQFSIRNRGSVAVYLGGDSSVTTSTGYQLDAGEAVAMTVAEGEYVYGIAASGSNAVHVLAQKLG
jgi:hypothetical protein